MCIIRSNNDTQKRKKGKEKRTTEEERLRQQGEYAFNQRNENEPGTDPDVVRLARLMQPRNVDTSRLPRTSGASPHKYSLSNAPDYHNRRPAHSPLPRGPIKESPVRSRRYQESKQPEEFELHNFNPRVSALKSADDTNTTINPQQRHRSDSVPSVVTVTSDQANEIREHPFMSVDGELLSLDESSSEGSECKPESQAPSSQTILHPRAGDALSDPLTRQGDSQPRTPLRFQATKERDIRRQAPRGPREINVGQRRKRNISTDAWTNLDNNTSSRTFRQQTNLDIPIPHSPPPIYQRALIGPRIDMSSKSPNQSAASAARNVPAGFQSTSYATAATQSRYPQIPAISQSKHSTGETQYGDIFNNSKC